MNAETGTLDETDVQMCRLAIETELLRREMIDLEQTQASHFLNLSSECLRQAGLRYGNRPDPLSLWRRLKLILAMKLLESSFRTTQP